MCPWLSSLRVTQKGALLNTPALSLSFAFLSPFVSRPTKPTQQSGLDSKGHIWGLIQFVGGGGREAWMIYWLLYKSRAGVVISFRDAVMRFRPVFSPRWCDFGPDIIIAAAVSVSVYVQVCVCICVLHDTLDSFYLEDQLKLQLSIFVHMPAIKSKCYFCSVLA